MFGKYVSKSEEEREEYVNEPTGYRDDTEGCREPSELEITASYLSYSEDKEKAKKLFVEYVKEQLAQQRNYLDSIINEVEELQNYKYKLEKKVLKLLESGKAIPASPHDKMEENLPSERGHFYTHTSSVDSGDDDSTKDPYSFSQNPEVMSGSMAAEEDYTMGCTEPSDLEAYAALQTSLERKEKIKKMSEDIYELLKERISEIEEVKSKIKLLRKDVYDFECRVNKLVKSLLSSAFGRTSGENVASERMSLTSTVSEDSGFGVTSKDD